MTKWIKNIKSPSCIYMYCTTYQVPLLQLLYHTLLYIHVYMFTWIFRFYHDTFLPHRIFWLTRFSDGTSHIVLWVKILLNISPVNSWPVDICGLTRPCATPIIIWNLQSLKIRQNNALMYIYITWTCNEILKLILKVFSKYLKGYIYIYILTNLLWCFADTLKLREFLF